MAVLVWTQARPVLTSSAANLRTAVNGVLSGTLKLREGEGKEG